MDIPAFYGIPTKLSFIGFECEKGHIKWGEREVCADVSNFPLAEFEFATFLKCRLANFVLLFHSEYKHQSPVCHYMHLLSTTCARTSLVGVFSTDKYVLFAHCGFSII